MGMTREEAINYLEISMAIDDSRYHNEVMEFIIKALEQEPKIEPKWIPCSERLPEAFESVLVCYELQDGMAQAVSKRFKTDTGYRWSALAGIEPIAWMPLQEPYKAEREEHEKDVLCESINV